MDNLAVDTCHDPLISACFLLSWFQMPSWWNRLILHTGNLLPVCYAPQQAEWHCSAGDSEHGPRRGHLLALLIQTHIAHCPTPVPQTGPPAGSQGSVFLRAHPAWPWEGAGPFLSIPANQSAHPYRIGRGGPLSPVARLVPAELGMGRGLES